MPTTSGYANQILALIDEDIAAGKPDCGKRMPGDVDSFSALHDYRDANMYVIDVMGDIALDFDNDASNALVNAVMDEVAARLAARAPAVRERMAETVRFAIAAGWTGIYCEYEDGQIPASPPDDDDVDAAAQWLAGNATA